MIFSSLPDIVHDPSAWQPEQADAEDILTVTDPLPESCTIPSCSIHSVVPCMDRDYLWKNENANL
jgi:hypothetical protein